MSAKSNPSKTDSKFTFFSPNTVLQTVSFARISWYLALQQKQLFCFFTQMKEKRRVEDKSQNYISKEKGTKVVFPMYCNSIIAPKNILIFESHV